MQRRTLTNEAAWTAHRTLAVWGKEIQQMGNTWRVYTPQGNSYDWGATLEADTLEAALDLAAELAEVTA